jgi:CRISPR-associated protein Csd1
MTILQALNAQYERMERRGEALDLGFTRENISYEIVIDANGHVLAVNDIRPRDDKKKRPAKMIVPRPKRTSNVQSNFLWDKTAYAFGVDGGKSKRLDREHAEFKRYHHEMLDHVDEPHAKAMLAFVDVWSQDMFKPPLFSDEMKDASFVFRLGDELQRLHDVPALRSIWKRSLSETSADAPVGMCLVSGTLGPLETGHPVIKGVDDAQTAGAYLVSANADAYTSYGHPTDSRDASTSVEAATRYGAALNALLERGTSRNRIKVGDATVVFWADASQFGEAAAARAEDLFFEAADPSSDEEKATQEDAARVKLHGALKDVAQGRAVAAFATDLPKGLRFHILGLAPNAARLAVRLWAVDDFSVFAARLEKHFAAIALDPPPWGARAPSVQRLLVRTTAVQEKFENIPPLLAGETLRAILTGAPYPRTLLSAAIGRLRAGDDPSRGWHAAVAKAVVNRTEKEHLPVSLDPDHPSPAYQLGRLFRVLEDAQYAALGAVNATIGDRYYAAASSTPARVFGPLLRGLRTHVADARKRGKGLWIEPRIAEIMARLPAELPKTLRLEDQARFAVGYYHERAARFEKHNDAEDATQGHAQ